MLADFVERLEKQIAQAIKKHSSVLDSGSVPDYETYKKITGHIAGLRESQDLIRSCLRNFDEDEDNLEEMKT